IAVKNKAGDWVVMNRNAKIAIYDDTGREREKYPVVHGARIKVKDASRVEAGQKLVEWDPYSLLILTEAGGKVAYGDIVEGVTMKTKDITGGLPRVAELFEARRPKEQAVISEIDGEISYGGFVKGMRKVVVDNKVGDVKEYFIPKGKHVNVHEGDWVRAGEPLMDGSANPHDILDVLGPKELQKYLVDEVQDVYRLQGVSINDKHIEIIVRQMLRKVRIEDPGDSGFLPGSQVSKF